MTEHAIVQREALQGDIAIPQKEAFVESSDLSWIGHKDLRWARKKGPRERLRQEEIEAGAVLLPRVMESA